MTLLYPSFLWMLIPLLLLFFVQKKRSLFSLIHLLVLSLILLALARPVIPEGEAERSVEAKDIIIALDVSYSMRAADILPTRYDFAQETIEHFLLENPKDNIMLIAFTSNPLLLSPPTTDHQLLFIALKSLDRDNILTKGTSLEHLFKKVASLEQKHKNLLLITDGGEEHDLEKLKSIIQTSDIQLTILATGTQKGTTIPRSNGTLLKDKENNLVISRINPLLIRLAEETKGTYLNVSSTPEATAYAVEEAINSSIQQGEFVSKKQHTYIELYQLPLLLAALLFIMLHTRAVKYLIVILAFAGINAQASMSDTYYLNQAYRSYEKGDFNASLKEIKRSSEISLQHQYALGNTYYKLGEYKQALLQYQSIRSTSPLIKQKLFYNIANVYTQLGEYDKAKIYYTRALQLGKDPDALYNLKLIALLQKKKALPGIAHPKSQNTSGTKSEIKDSDKEAEKAEEQSGSGSGSGGESQHAEGRQKKKKRLIFDDTAEPQPLSSKVYELINKGYIRETQPW